MTFIRKRSPYSKCKECGQAITWLLTRNKKKIPVDGELIAIEQLFDRTVHTPHFETCPKRIDRPSSTGGSLPKKRLRTDFGPISEELKAKMAATRAQRPFIIPEWKKTQLRRIQALSARSNLAPQEVSRLYKHHCGISQFKHLQFCTDMMLSRLERHLKTFAPQRSEIVSEVIVNGQKVRF